MAAEPIKAEFAAIIKNAWGVGSLFFGLCLIPMGYKKGAGHCKPACNATAP